MPKRVLITGGTGFLGVYAARKFLKEEFEVVLFDTAPLDAKDLKDKVIVIQSDIRNKKAVMKACKNVDYIVHAAAALPIQRARQKIYSVNIEGTRNVLNAALANNVKKVIFISSTAVYGVPKVLPETETSPLKPIGWYGKSKVAGEKLCKEYNDKGLATIILRPKTFLGPERLGVFSLWFEAIYLGHRVFILGNGKNKYQLLAVTDVVDAIYNAIMSNVKNEIFNIGAKDFQTWRKDLKFVIKTDKSRSKITGLPVLPTQVILQLLELLHLSPLAAWHYKTMPVDSYVSITKAHELLNWTPKKSNQDLLLESYLWYKKNRNKILDRKGKTHRVNWNFRLLNLVSKI